MRLVADAQERWVLRHVVQSLDADERVSAAELVDLVLDNVHVKLIHVWRLGMLLSMALSHSTDICRRGGRRPCGMPQYSRIGKLLSHRGS